MTEKKALISKIKIENDQTATIEFKKSTDMNNRQESGGFGRPFCYVSTRTTSRSTSRTGRS